MLRHALRLVLALALGLSPALASAELYRWVDELGVTHYTTDPDEIPSEFRRSGTPIPTTREPTRTSVPRGPKPPPRAPRPAVTAAPSESAAPNTAPAPNAAPAPSVAPAPSPTRQPSALAAPPLVAPPAQPSEATPVAPSTEPTVFPGPPSVGTLPPDDPRAAEVASLEAQIATDRESLRQIISTKRWDSAELASDPQIREIAERLPRLQAQLEALRAEPVP